jgi:hypothetical protein
MSIYFSIYFARERTATTFVCAEHPSHPVTDPNASPIRVQECAAKLSARKYRDKGLNSGVRALGGVKAYYMCAC